MIKFRCDRCKAVIQCSDTHVGQHVTCPTCQHKQAVPHREALRPNKLLLWAGIAAAVLAAAWGAWSMMRRAQPTPAEGTEATPGKAAQPAVKGEAASPIAPAPSRTPAIMDLDPRDPRSKERAETARTDEEMRLRQQAIREWQAKDAMRREAERLEQERKKQEETEARNKAEFERKQKAKEYLEEQRKQREQPVEE